MKQLYRSRKNKIFFGLFGGVGEFFKIDPTIIRIGYIIIMFITGFLPGALAYVVCSLIVPFPPKEGDVIYAKAEEVKKDGVKKEEPINNPNKEVNKE